jgi:hypothetical protein
MAVFGLVLVVQTASGEMQSPLSSEGFSLWLAGLLTVFILSFLYADNPFYRFAESVFIGVSAAYTMVQGFWNGIHEKLLMKVLPEAWVWFVGIVEPDRQDTLAGEVQPLIDGLSWTGRLWYSVPAILGVLLLCRLVPKVSWLGRWPLAFIVGWAAGTNMVTYLTSDFIEQVNPSIASVLVFRDGALAFWPTVSAVVAVGGLLCALIYFFFSVEHKGVISGASRAGIWVLMITFGAAFGYTVMGRVALLVERMEFLFMDWTGLIAG